MIGWIKKKFNSISGYVEKQFFDYMVFFGLIFVVIYFFTYLVEIITANLGLTYYVYNLYSSICCIYIICKLIFTIRDKGTKSLLTYQFLINFRPKYYSIYLESLFIFLFFSYIVYKISAYNENVFGLILITAMIGKIYISVLINNLGKILLNKKVEAMYAGNEIKVKIYDEIFQDSIFLIDHLHDSVMATMQDKINSEKLKTDLITNISHDLKTPLTSIINYVDLLKYEKDDQERERYTEILSYNAKRLKSLLVDLIYASKTGTGNVELNMEPIELNELVLQVYGQFDSDFDKKNLSFEYNDIKDRIVMLTDGSKLSRVIENIFSNIVKYSEEATEVYGESNVVDNNIILTFKNKSKNKIEGDSNNLLNQFVRGEKSRHSEGSGLGLYIAKNLVEILGGNIYILSQDDYFILTLKFKITGIKRNNK
ncbi:MAG: HAMP domain-containing sensor histidine kinase [Finegoldia sp.]|nr:HAMP domain-containing sensor histidine kinase [Finegoldia sp.]